jgi:hypothetical protein
VFRSWLALAFLPQLLAAQVARVPLPLERVAPIFNEWGAQVAERSRVEVISSRDSRVLFATRIGAGVNGSDHPGAFVSSIIPRPT